MSGVAPEHRPAIAQLVATCHEIERDIRRDDELRDAKLHRSASTRVASS